MARTDDQNVAQIADKMGAILPTLYEDLDQLSPALGRVAKYIIENPDKVVQLSIADLGAISGSGEASVVRLCRTMGFAGFRQFKVALASELGRSSSAGIDANRQISSHVKIIHTGLYAMLDEAIHDLDERQLDRAAISLAQARRVDIYGAGVSGIIGELFAYRLLKLRLNAQAFRDANMAHEVANGLGSDCTTIAISESGLTPDTHKFLQTAKRAGATTIALVTRLRSPVAEFADIVFRTPPSLHRPTIDAIASAPAKILVIEAITAALAAKLAVKR